MAGSLFQMEKEKIKKHLNHVWWEQPRIQSIPWAGKMYDLISVNF